MGRPPADVRGRPSSIGRPGRGYFAATSLHPRLALPAHPWLFDGLSPPSPGSSRRLSPSVPCRRARGARARLREGCFGVTHSRAPLRRGSVRSVDRLPGESSAMVGGWRAPPMAGTLGAWASPSRALALAPRHAPERPHLPPAPPGAPRPRPDSWTSRDPRTAALPRPNTRAPPAQPALAQVPHRKSG